MTKTIKQLSYLCCYEGGTVRFYSMAEKTYRLVQLFPQHLKARALTTCLFVLDALEDWTTEPILNEEAELYTLPLEAAEYRDLLPHLLNPYPDVTPLDTDLAYPSGSPEIWARRLSNMIRDLLHDH